MSIHAFPKKKNCLADGHKSPWQQDVVMMQLEDRQQGEALPCHHQELVDLRVFELVVGVPHLGLQLLLDPVV